MKSLQSTANLTTGRAMARKWVVDWELARPEHNVEKRKPAFHSRVVTNQRFSDDDVNASCFGRRVTIDFIYATSTSSTASVRYQNPTITLIEDPEPSQ